MFTVRKDIIMKHMQEDEFNKLPEPTHVCKPGEHEVVKLYDLGTHSDYGCIKCKIRSLDLTFFEITR